MCFIPFVEWCSIWQSRLRIRTRNCAKISHYQVSNPKGLEKCAGTCTSLYIFLVMPFKVKSDWYNFWAIFAKSVGSLEL